VARRSASRFRSHGPRRKTAWGFGPGGTGVNAISASTSVILTSAVALTVEQEVTLVRLRGLFSWYLTAATSAADGFQGAIGITLVSTPAFTAGVTSVPTPITEMAWEGWLYHRMISIHGSSAGDVSSDAANESFEVDTKAQRIWEDDQTLIAVVEVIEVGAAAAQINFDSRLLVMLP